MVEGRKEQLEMKSFLSFPVATREFRLSGPWDPPFTAVVSKRAFCSCPLI